MSRSKFKWIQSGCLMLLGLFATTQVSADLFTDNFGMGADAIWQNNSGSWDDSGGVYQASVPDNLPNAHSALPFELTDFNVELDINNVADGGVWLRSAGAAGTTIGRTGVLLVTGVNGGLYWHNVSDGNTYGGASGVVNGLFSAGADPHLRIEVSGDQYSVFVDGADIAATSLTTNNFSSGQIALYDNSAQTFDNIVVSVPEPATGALIGLAATLVFLSDVVDEPMTRSIVAPPHWVARRPICCGSNRSRPRPFQSRLFGRR